MFVVQKYKKVVIRGKKFYHHEVKGKNIRLFSIRKLYDIVGLSVKRRNYEMFGICVKLLFTMTKYSSRFDFDEISELFYNYIYNSMDTDFYENLLQSFKDNFPKSLIKKFTSLLLEYNYEDQGLIVLYDLEFPLDIIVETMKEFSLKDVNFSYYLHGLYFENCCDQIVSIMNHYRQTFDKENIKIASKMLECPISKKPFLDPVIASDGYTYERSFITEWIKHGNCSPITKKPLTSVLITNKLVKKIML